MVFSAEADSRDGSGDGFDEMRPSTVVLLKLEVAEDDLSFDAHCTPFRRGKSRATHI